MQASTTTAFMSGMEPLQNLLYKRLRPEFTYGIDRNVKVLMLTLTDKMREAAGRMEENSLSCQAGISSSGCSFLNTTGY